MKLSEVFQRTKGVLSHAERDFYLAFCAFADNDTGFCFPRMATVAEAVGASRSSASRMFSKLENLGFIKREKGGFRCLLGYHSDNKSYQESNKSYQGDNYPTENSYQGDNKSSHSDNSSYQGDNSHIKEGTIHLTNTNTNAAFAADVSSVFEEWKRILNHPKAQLDEKRKKRIKARLKEGFSADDLKKALRGVLKSPYHLGQNASKTRYDGIDTVFRDRAQVEKFMELATERTDEPPLTASFDYQEIGEKIRMAEQFHRQGLPIPDKYLVPGMRVNGTAN